MKYIVIVPDGMADYPLEELGGKTPLEAARTTNMDHMAQNGMTGLIQTIPDKMKPGSDIGNLSLLGYDPRECFTGRAPLEAANQGIILGENEIAFRCNLVTVENGKMLDYSAGHISDKEARPLIEALNEGIDDPDVRFIPGKGYRHLMIMKSLKAPQLLQIQCTPPHDLQGQEFKKFLPEGVHAPLILKYMEKSRNIIADHPVNKVRVDLKENPANMIWLWGQGGRPELPLFQNKFGIRGAIISAVDLINGIGRLTGLEIIHVPGATGYYDTDYAAKGAHAVQALKKNDFVYVHIEAPDEAGHNGHIKEKVQAIERIDRDIVGTVLNHFNNGDDVRIVVLPDHPTPISLRTHSSDPVPFVMYGKGVPQDTAQKYGESTAKKIGLKFKSGEEMMDFFIRKHL